MKKIKFCTIISFMEIYYIEKESFLKKGGKKLIEPFIDNSKNSMEKRIDNAIGRYITDSILKNVYKKENYQITRIKNKPYLKDENIYFNISHSGNIVLVAFDENNVGIDIEMKKLRDIKKLRKRYNKNFNTLDDFYTFWTQYEAMFKLQDKPKKVVSFDFGQYYKITIASSSETLNFKMFNFNK